MVYEGEDSMELEDYYDEELESGESSMEESGGSEFIQRDSRGRVDT